MLQVAKIRENFDLYVQGLKKRGFQSPETTLQDIIDKDQSRKETQQELDSVLSESNKLAKSIGALMKQDKKEEAEEVKKQTSILKEKSKTLGEKQSTLEDEIKQALYDVPNVPNPLVKPGKNEEDNEVMKTSGELPELAGAKPHWDLIDQYDIVDFGLGNKVSGAGFPFYKGAGARMVRGMVNLFLDEAAKAGYREIQPPVVINQDSGYGTGQLPDKEGQMYHITDSQQYLIPTAEVPITNMYRDVMLSEKELPIKLAGYTPCFRREAGSWGAHVRGLNRLHQFDKVEIVQIVRPEKSYEVLEEMVAHVEALVKKLELPYRILRLCAGDLGFTSALTYDFEVYSAAQKKWLEVSSVSNFETYQANRLKLRYKAEDGKKYLAHTLNGSALAIPRILAALLENNQEENLIHVPEILQSYTGLKTIEKP